MQLSTFLKRTEYSLTKRFFALAIVLLLLVGWAFQTQAAFNNQINYQGKLTTAAGVAVTDGTYSIVFSLYTVSSGGSNIWTETQNVTVEDGLFSVMLGSSTALSGVDFDQTLYLGVNVEADGEMTPRKVLGAVPAAFVADTVDGVDSTSFVRSDEADEIDVTDNSNAALTITQSGTGDILNLFDGASEVFTVLDGGNVGIGTASPDYQLHVHGDGITASNTSGAAIVRVDRTDGKIGALRAGNSTIGFDYDSSGSFQIAPRTRAVIEGTTFGATSTGITMDGSGNVGIGTSSPTQPLDIRSDSYYSLFQAISNVSSSSNDGGNILIGLDDGAAMASGDRLGQLLFAGAKDASNTLAYTASVTGVATENWGSSATGTAIDFYVTPNTSTTRTFAMRIDEDGSVGIGTTSVDTKLHVEGGVIKSEGTSSMGLVAEYTGGKAAALTAGTLSSNFLFDDSGDFTIQAVARANLITGSNSGASKVLSVESNGNVGILSDNAQNPSTALHIFRSNTSTTPMQEIEQLSTGDAGLQFSISGDAYALGIDNSDDDKFKISYAAGAGTAALGTNDRLVIDASGNVGIGTTDPGYLLDVQGTGVVTNYQRNTSDTNALRAIANFRHTTDGTIANGFGAVFNFEIEDGSGDNALAQMGAYRSGGTDNAGTFVIRTSNTSDSIVDAMVIDHNQNVGIGTASPSTLLEVSGASTPRISVTDTTNTVTTQIASDNTIGYLGTLTNHTLGFYTNGTTRMFLDTSGNLGIGGTPTAGRLYLTGVGTASRLVINSTGTANAGINLQENGSNTWTLASYSSGTFTFYNAALGNESLGIDASNNVVWNEAGLDADFRIESDTNANALFLEGSSGNIGIGMASPGATLNIKMSTTSTPFLKLQDQGNASVFEITDQNSASGTVTPRAVYGSDLSWIADNANIGFNALWDGLVDGRWEFSNTNRNTYRIHGGTNSASDVLSIDYGDHGSAGSAITWSTGIVLNDTGNVGIGTSTPSAGLSVANGRIRAESNTSPSAGAGLELGYDGTSGLVVAYDRGAAAYKALTLNALTHSFQTSGTTKMTIDNSGNVGIGTTSPDTILDVSYNANNAGPSSNSMAIFQNESTGSSAQTRVGLYRGGDTGTGYFRGSVFFTTSTGAGWADYENRSMQFYTGSGVSSAARLTIDNAGNVGIGATSPGSLLTIDDSASSSTLVNIGAAPSPTAALAVNTDGNIGAIQTYHNGNLQLQFGTNLNFADGAQARFFSDEFVTENARIEGTNGDAWFLGEVGIGTTSPDAALDISSGDFITTGSVGIGSTTPQTYLHLSRNNALTTPQIENEQLGSGDAGMQFSIPGDAFALGIDNTDDRFKISYAAAAGTAVLGTNDYLEIDSTGRLFLNPTPSAFDNGITITGTGNNSGVIAIENTTATGYSGFNIFDSTSTLAANLTYGNPSAGAFTDEFVIASRQSDIDVTFYQGGAASTDEQLRMSPTELVINEQSVNLDFRVESNGNANMLFVDGGNDRVGIGTAIPSAQFHVLGSSAGIFLERTGGAEPFILVYDGNFSHGGQIRGRTDVSGFNFTDAGDTTDYMSVTASGIGIGETSPQTNLHISESNTSALPGLEIEQLSTGDAGLQFSISGDAYALGIDNSDDDKFKISYAAGAGTAALGTNDRLVIDASGNVGIGTVSPDARLEVSATGNPVAKLDLVSASSDTILELSADDGVIAVNSNFLVWSDGGVDLGVIRGDGNVGIGTTNPQQELHVVTTADDSPVRFEDADGYCEINPTTTTWSCTSDESLKTNITSLDRASSFDAILALRPVEFEWKTNRGKTRQGLIAQEVEDIFPELVSTDKVTGLKSVAYGGLTIHLISAVQELNEKMDMQLAAIGVAPQGILESVMHFAELVVDRLRVKTIEVEEGIQIKDQETGEIYCVVVRGGELVHEEGECGESASSNTGDVEENSSNSGVEGSEESQDETSEETQSEEEDVEDSEGTPDIEEGDPDTPEEETDVTEEADPESADEEDAPEEDVVQEPEEEQEDAPEAEPEAEEVVESAPEEPASSE